MDAGLWYGALGALYTLLPRSAASYRYCLLRRST